MNTHPTHSHERTAAHTYIGQRRNDQDVKEAASYDLAAAPAAYGSCKLDHFEATFATLKSYNIYIYIYIYIYPLLLYHKFIKISNFIRTQLFIYKITK